jgi:hypothetical protein
MRVVSFRFGTVLAIVAAAAIVVATTGRAPSAAEPVSAPALSSIGPLTFAPDGTPFAADPQAATIYAFDLGATATGVFAGAKGIEGIDRQIAAMLGTEPSC